MRLRCSGVRKGYLEPQHSIGFITAVYADLECFGMKSPKLNVDPIHSPAFRKDSSLRRAPLQAPGCNFRYSGQAGS